MPAAKKKQIAKTAKKIVSAPQHLASNELVLTKAMGGNISEYPVEFTDDSKYFFACAESNIKVYSVITGEVIKSLSALSTSGGHTDKVVFVKLNPKNHLQLYSASMDGTIKLWDYNDDIVLKTFKVGKAIHYIDISTSSPEYAYIVTRESQDEVFTTYQYFLGDQETDKTRLRKIVAMANTGALAVSPSGSFVAIAGADKVAVWTATEGDDDVTEEQIVNVSTQHCVTALAFHPSSANAHLAMGDRMGRIVICDNCLSPESVQNPKTRHWHEDAVRVLTFMEDGHHLMSGGNESVVVLWQLETTFMQFLPRLGGAINSIRVSPDYKYYCVGLTDNTFQLIKHVEQKLVRTIQGLHYDTNSLSSTGLVLDPRNHHLALSAGNGSVLFYDVLADRCAMLLQVAPRMQVREKDLDLARFNVDHVAFLPGGEWMATVDNRNDNATTPEMNLKFWKWNPNSQKYLLHTRVDHPHAKPITSLTFNPSFARHGTMAITTSVDGTFKVWCNVSTSEVDDQSMWTCRSVGEYRNYQPHCVAVSDDGSILAVGFGRSITLWDPYLNRLRTVLNHTVSGDIRKIQFLPNTPFLVATSSAKSHTYLQVWNLLSGSDRDWWSCRLAAHDPLLLVDPLSPGRFSVIYHSPDSLAEQSRVVVFEAKSATPLLVQTLPHKALAATYIPREDGEGESRIIYLHGQCDLALLSMNKSGTSVSEENGTTAVQKNSVLSMADQDKTILNDLFGRRSQTEKERQERDQARLHALNTKEARLHKADMGSREGADHTSPLSVPSHVLPSVDKVFETFMESLMSLRLKDMDENEVEAMEVDEESPEDAELAQTAESVENPENAPVRLDEFTSLNAYFAESLKSNGTTTAQAPAQSPSSDEEDDDTDEDGDPSQIEW